MQIDECFHLTNLVAVVTGGGSGIGRGIAVRMAQAGAAVVVADIAEARATDTADAITGDGGRAIAARADTTSRGDVDAAVQAAVDVFGTLDIMCNIAGVRSDGPLVDATEADLDRLFAINVKGIVFGCQAAARVMAPRRRGVIINASSSSIDVPATHMGVYGLTKSAVVTASSQLAHELGPHGIRVNAIAPGATVTAFSGPHLLDANGELSPERVEQFEQRLRQRTMLGSIGDVDDQALLAVYLASPAAKFATGATFRVNGGLRMDA